MGLFDNLGATTQTQSGSNLFGNSSTSQPQKQTSLFGTTASTSAASGGLFGTASAQPQSTSLFGNTTAAKPATSNLFGNTAAQPAQSGGLFGKTAPQPASTSLFGASTTNNQNAQAGKNLFSGFGATTQNAPADQQLAPAPQDLTQSMMDSRRIWNEEDGAPRARTVLEQLQMVNRKWDSTNSQNSFQAYLYNKVAPEAAPFYRPSPGENEEAWEAALRKAPSADHIPFRVSGFEELGKRIVVQKQSLTVLEGRLHEINQGLSLLLRKHELDITTRASAARRRHAALSQRVLTLATKTMVARNRGYQLGPAEERLRKRLAELERDVTDPSINGREEEIWARMVQIREQGKQLEAEMERAGLDPRGEKSTELSEEVVKQAEKILTDYDKQLSHLTKELERIKDDWEEWEQSKSGADGDSKR